MWQFMNIVHSGVKIITSQDNTEYTRENMNENAGNLSESLQEITRAHKESKRKSYMLQKAWIDKRSEALKGKPLTRITPLWIRLNGSGEMTMIPKLCKAVELMFRKKLAGKGTATIARELNDDPDISPPPVRKRNESGVWCKPTINRILRNREVIGEYQPCKLVNGRRQPEGEVIKGYFPAAIDEELFYSVQEYIRRNRERRGYSGGRTGKCNNLFTHIVKCGLCGAPMHYIDHGQSPKGGQYLHCDAARRLHTCKARPVRYDEFERIFFENFDYIDVEQFIPGEDEMKAKLTDLQRTMTSTVQHIHETEQEITNLTDSIRKTSDERVRERLDKELSSAFDKRDIYQNEYKALEQEYQNVTRQRTELKKNIDQSVEIYRLLNSTVDEQERINIRLRLRTYLQRLLEHVKIVPLQEEYHSRREVKSGIWRWMDSRYIARIGYKFRDGKVHGMIRLTGTIDEDDY